VENIGKFLKMKANQ